MRSKATVALAVLLLVAAAAPARSAQPATPPEQQWPTRSWDELKAETQARADRGAYPLADTRPEDVHTVLDQIHSLDRDEWAKAWMAMGDHYLAQARNEEKGDRQAARQDFFLAWRYYTLGRFPVPNSAGKMRSYDKAREAFAAYGNLMDPKIEEVRIPFEGHEIVGLLQKPEGIPRPPVLLGIGGVDQWKDSAAVQSRPILKNGIAVLTLDMPGTGEAPLGTAPGAERIYSAAIDHLLSRSDVDGKRIVVRGQSWGSYWALRVAYAEPSRLVGAVAQSGPVDGYFSREWQQQSLKSKEYLFDFVPSRLYIMGKKTVDEMLDAMPALSLKAEGLIDKPTPPILLVGGEHDTQTPIADLVLVLRHGSPKYAWVNPDGGHMGRSKTLKDETITETVILPWISERLSRNGIQP